MIHLVCTHCKVTLEMDDAFAGGACRCQHCGTIQTVPTQARSPQIASSNADTVQTPAIPSPAGKALYQSGSGSPKSAPHGRTAAGLDELAGAVASSGLSSSGLKSGRLKQKETKKEPEKPAEKAKPTARDAPATAPTGSATTAPSSAAAKVIEKGKPYLTIVAGAVVAIVAALVLWRYISRGPSAGSGEGTPGQAGVVVGGGPGFCGTPISDASVIYLLDRGSGSSATFSYLKEATFKSIESLGSRRKFQIMFWDNGGIQVAYPADAFTFATSDNAEAARRALEDVFAFGDTNVRSALEKAVSRGPGAIVLATAKGWQLDDSFVTTVSEIRGASPVKIHTFAIGGAGDSTALKQIAEKTGGKFADVTDAQLHGFTNK